MRAQLSKLVALVDHYYDDPVSRHLGPTLLCGETRPGSDRSAESYAHFRHLISSLVPPVICDSGQSTRSTLIRRAWLRCGAKHYWLARYCAGKHEAIGIIRSCSAFGCMRCLVTRLAHILRLSIPRQQRVATPLIKVRLAHCVRWTRFRPPRGRSRMSGSIVWESYPCGVGYCTGGGAQSVCRCAIHFSGRYQD